MEVNKYVGFIGPGLVSFVVSSASTETIRTIELTYKATSSSHSRKCYKKCLMTLNN